MKFVAAYSDEFWARAIPTVKNDEPSLTIQSHAEDCDITRIAAAMEQGLFRPRGPEPMFGDFTGIVDYRSAVKAVGEAYEGFMQFPAKVRARFRNDPAELLAFMEDPDNYDEGLKLGLFKERVRGAGNEQVAGSNQQFSSVQPNEGGRSRDAGSDSRSQPAGAGGAGGDRPA